jgi:CubicO group peptidase (beta-lactamase class C family)
MKRTLATIATIFLLVGFSTRSQGQAVATRSIAETLQPFVNNHELAGAVTLVANSEQILAIDTVGYADISTKTPMKADSLFWIASMTKPMTCVALMMLVEEGKIQLDAPISQYLPEYKDAWVAVESDKDRILLRRPQRAVTVRDLMRHTSGLPFRSPNEDEARDYLGPEKSAKFYAQTRLGFEPGTKYLYSSAGINLVGRLIEIGSGMSYDDFLVSRLLKPLGMKDTTFWPTDEQLKRLATSYRPNKSKDNLEPTTIYALHAPYSDHDRKTLPGGGLFSTASDLNRFCQMMLNKGVLNGRRYISEATVAEMTKRQTAPSIKESHGLGFATNNGIFGHGGAYSTNMSIDPQSGLITIFLVQHRGFPGKGDTSHAAFVKAAREQFATKAK